MIPRVSPFSIPTAVAGMVFSDSARKGAAELSRDPQFHAVTSDEGRVAHPSSIGRGEHPDATPSMQSLAVMQPKAGEFRQTNPTEPKTRHYDRRPTDDELVARILGERTRTPASKEQFLAVATGASHGSFELSGGRPVNPAFDFTARTPARNGDHMHSDHMRTRPALLSERPGIPATRALTMSPLALPVTRRAA